MRRRPSGAERRPSGAERRPSKPKGGLTGLKGGLAAQKRPSGAFWGRWGRGEGVGGGQAAARPDFEAHGRHGSQGRTHGPHEKPIRQNMGPKKPHGPHDNGQNKQQVKEAWGWGRARPNSRGRSGNLGHGSAHARMVSSTSSTAERRPPESHHSRPTGSSCKAAARARTSNEAHRAVQARCASCRRKSR